MLRGLRTLKFLDVIFQIRQDPPVMEGEGGGSEERDDEEVIRNNTDDNDNAMLDKNDPIPSLRRSLAVHLPSCTLIFSNCSVQINAE